MMGEQQGMVSLWIGHVDEPAVLDRIVKVDFSEDGDFEGCEFSRAFEVGYYDAGVFEREFRADSTRSMVELLRGASYHDRIAGKLAALGEVDPKTNCFVLIYNHVHEGPQSGHGTGWQMKFFGSVSYET